MKNTILIITAATLLLALNSNAQIKVLTTGQTAIGTYTTYPSGISTYISGIKPRIGYLAGYLNFDFGVSDPRISVNSDNYKVVFYKSNNSGYADIEVRNCYERSDEKDKTNIKSISDGLSVVKKLRGVSFQWKQDANNKNVKTDYGLIAQEVEKVIPNIVLTEDSSGSKTMAYRAIIPYLVEAIKEQQMQIDSLKKLNQGSKLKSAQVAVSITDETTEPASLDQNAPNPFSQATQIGYFLPETINSATLNIYNMSGAPVKTIPIFQKGKGSITINGAELNPGMYLYTLIADGKEVDTKRMILTE